MTNRKDIGYALHKWEIISYLSHIYFIKKEHTMKNSIKIMALLSVALVTESVLTIGHFRKYKSEIAHDKIRAI